MENPWIRGALLTVAREKCAQGFTIDSMDEKVFNDALQTFGIGDGEKYINKERMRIFVNKTSAPYDFIHASQGYERASNEVKHNVGNAAGCMSKNEVGINVERSSSHARKEEGQQWRNDNIYLPPQTRVRELYNRYSIVQHIKYGCQADLPIRVYPSKHVKDGAAVGGAVGGFSGAIGGAATGALNGALVCSVIPGAGSVVGGVIGGIGGGVAGMLGLGAIGSGTGAGFGAAVSNAKCVLITAKEVFRKLEKFKFSEKNNMVYCELPMSTECELHVAEHTEILKRLPK